MMMRLSVPVAILLIAAGAIVHGNAVHRWEEPSSEAGRFQALHAHTVTLGDYTAEEVPNDMPVKERSVATSKRYWSPTRMQAAVVSVISGAPGSVATHTPDVCYPASGYKTVRPPTRETLDLPGIGPVQYFVAEFEKKTETTTDRQRVRWAWTTGDKGWEVPDHARVKYLRVADLAKVYIVNAVPPVESVPADAADSPALREFVAAAFLQYAAQAAQ